MTILSFLFRRASHHWQLLVTLSLGVILATAFLVSGPVLVNAIVEFGLRRTLLNAGEVANVLRLTARESPHSDQYQALDEQVHSFLQERFKDRFTQVIPSGHVGLMYPWQEGYISTDYRLALSFYGANPDQRADVIAGSWPADSRQESGMLAVVVEPSFAADYDLEIGERVPVSLNARAQEPELWLIVTGIMAAVDQGPSWNRPVNYNVFVTAEDFFTLAPELFPSLDAQYTWHVFLALDQITSADLAVWQALIGTVDQEVLQTNSSLRAHTSLGELLKSFATQVNIVRAPLYFLIGIVVLMALYYLVMMATLSLDRVRPEFAVLRSRGASGSQLFLLQLLEATLIGAIAITSGPLLAWLFVRGLATHGPLSVVAEADWALTLPQAAWLAAIVAAVACISSLLLPLPAVLRHSIVTHQQSAARASRPPWWQRAYLDVFVLTVGLILLWRMQLYGSIIGDSAETTQVDFLLLLAPSSLLIGAAAIFLRLFPVLLQRGAQLVSRRRGLPAALAFWQASRDPRHVTGLVLLLMLAMTLGIFSTSLNAALNQNEQERSQYYVGSDVRLVAADVETEVATRTAVQATSVTWRTRASLDFGTTFPSLSLLAIDPTSFNDVAHYRPDFARRPVPQLLAEMEGDWDANRLPVPDLLLPGQPARVGLWLLLPFTWRDAPDRFEMLDGITFEAKLYSAKEEEVTVPLRLTETADGDWYYFEGSVPEMSYPAHLRSLWIHNSLLKLEWDESLFVDDITAFDRNGGVGIVVDNFEDRDASDWHSVTFPMTAAPVKINARSGMFSLGLYSGRAGLSPVRWYGINQVADSALQPIPALVSPAFQSRTELQPGDLVRMSVQIAGASEWDQVTFKIVDAVYNFPTMYETEEAGFLVTLRDPLLEQINLHRYTPVRGNELFVATTRVDTAGAFLATLDLPAAQVLSVDAMLQSLKSHPLALGLRSVTLFGYFLTTVLSLVGFGSHFYSSTRQRATNYGILRALGLSPRQLYTTLLLEQVLLILSGLALGTILGLLLNKLTLSGLPLRLGEWAVVPPFVTQTDWMAVVRIYFTLAVAFFLSLGIATLSLWRVRIHRALRIGEE